MDIEEKGSDPEVITTEAELRAIYGQPSEMVMQSVLDFLHDHHVAYIRASPFICMASVGGGSCSVSPRGGERGFVKVVDRKTLAIPDFPGNNRIDTLCNVIRDGHLELAFLFPGQPVFLRVNGTGEVTRNEALRRSLAHKDREPITVVRLKVESVFFQCGRAVVRSRLWSADSHIASAELPSVGTVLRDLARIKEMDSEQLDALYRCKLQEDLY